jgi:predicted N-acetyltransferase YhbS/diadenosine tetraphosphate (Ap4A) HIT family hydrolase
MVEIRRMMASDAEAVTWLSIQLGYDASPDAVRNWVTKDDARRIALVAVADGEVVGWVQAHDRELLQSPRVAEIGGLVVDKGWRGSGVGRRLVDAVAEWGRERWHTGLYVRSNVVRDGAHGFYERLGFERVKTSHTYTMGIESAAKAPMAAPEEEPSAIPSCLACDLTAGTIPLPGGEIHREKGWVVEHCVGPLGLGTLIVKPERHVTHVADLNDVEARAMGPLLHRAAQVVTELCEPNQVYISLWSHAGGAPGHIHYVVQPIATEDMDRHGAHGPVLQVAMFEDGLAPDQAAIVDIADRARAVW